MIILEYDREEQVNTLGFSLVFPQVISINLLELLRYSSVLGGTKISIATMFS